MYITCLELSEEAHRQQGDLLNDKGQIDERTGHSAHQVDHGSSENQQGIYCVIQDR